MIIYLVNGLCFIMIMPEETVGVQAGSPRRRARCVESREPDQFRLWALDAGRSTPSLRSTTMAENLALWRRGCDGGRGERRSTSAT